MTLSELTYYPVAAIVAFAVTYALVPVLIRIAPALGLFDMPCARRVHKAPVPRCGGIAVFIDVNLACALVVFTPAFTYTGTLDFAWWQRFAMLSAAIAALGVIDDRFDIKPRLKLAGQIAVATAAFAWGFRVSMVVGLHLPLGVDAVITILWFIGVINAFNLIDGMDGVASGLGMIAALAMAGQALLQKQAGDALIPLALFAACAAFLRYNFHPASIFLGDGGSMFIGFAVAALALSLRAKSTTVTALAIPLLAVGVPFFDTFLAIWRRSVRRFCGAGRSCRIFGADMDHLHHRLLRRGFTQRQVALIFYALATTLVIFGFASLLLRSHSLAIYLLAFVAAVYVIVRHLAYVEMWDSTKALLQGIQKLPRKAVGVMVFVGTDVFILAVSLALTLLIAVEQLSFYTWKNQFLSLAPWWIGLPFLALAIAQTYKRVWSRSRVFEFLYLNAALAVGALLAASVRDMIIPATLREETVFFLVFLSLSAPMISSLRILPRSILECAQLLLPHHGKLCGVETTQTLIYGAGQRCTLYLRARMFRIIQSDSTQRQIIGLIDDDTNLHGRYVHGYCVLGGLAQLKKLLPHQNIQEIILIADLDAANWQTFTSVMQQYKQVKITRWYMGFVEVNAADNRAQTAAASAAAQEQQGPHAPEVRG